MPALRDLLLLGLLGLTGCATTIPVQDKVRQVNDVGLNEFSQGNFGKARESFAYALELTPNDPNLLFNLAQCLERLGRDAEAEEYYVLCLQKSPGQVESRYALVMVYYRTGRKTEAVRLLQEWMTEQPGSPEPYVLDGWRLRQEQDVIGARERLFQALGKDIRNVHALTELGILYETMNLPEQALVLYERSLARDPNQPEVIQRLAQLRLRNVTPPRPD